MATINKEYSIKNKYSNEKQFIFESLYSSNCNIYGVEKKLKTFKESIDTS